MTEDLGHIPVRKQLGSEMFTDGGADLGFDLLGFWQWSDSDLVANTARGILAEYLVARALGVDVSGVRDGWAAYDLATPSGVKVEVKSAAYLQSWHQTKPSSISFSVPKTRAWDVATGLYEDVARRQADVYVFAILAHREKATLNPMDVSQWEFHVVATSLLNDRVGSHGFLALRTLTRLSRGPRSYGELPKAVEAAALGRFRLG